MPSKAQLVWASDYPDAVPPDFRVMIAQTPFGSYQVTDKAGIWGYEEGSLRWTVSATFLGTRDREGVFQQRFTTREAAQAFCDADYALRIRAALAQQGGRDGA